MSIPGSSAGSLSSRGWNECSMSGVTCTHDLVGSWMRMASYGFVMGTFQHGHLLTGHFLLPTGCYLLPMPTEQVAGLLDKLQTYWIRTGPLDKLQAFWGLLGPTE